MTTEAIMNDSMKLILAYYHFSEEQRTAVNKQFQALAAAYPEKCYHTSGFTDLWLTAINDIASKESPWL